MNWNRTIIVAAFSATVALAADTAVTKPPAKPAANAAPQPAPLTIPRDAIENPDGTYAWTDKQGKKWKYLSTPFGVTRVAETAPSSTLPKGVPAGATPNPDGTYSFTDKDGGQWTYMLTPFGLSRTMAMPRAEPESRLARVRVVDKGETVRFERSGGPMGVSVWEKKKSELSASERDLLNKQFPEKDQQLPEKQKANE